MNATKILKRCKFRYFFSEIFLRTIIQKGLQEDGPRRGDRGPAVRFLRVPLHSIGRGFLYFKETCCIFSSFFFLENFPFSPSALNTINFFFRPSRGFICLQSDLKGLCVFISLAVGRLCVGRGSKSIFCQFYISSVKGTWRVFRLGVNPTPPT